MNKTVHYLGLDVHKETIAVAIAPGDSSENIELRFIYEAGPCGYVLCRFPRVRQDIMGFRKGMLE